jgi:hypothetical protein
MVNPLSKYGVSDDELRKAISESAEVDAALNEFMQTKVVPYWKAQTPVDEGHAAASVKVTKKAKGGRGLVSMTDYKAHWLEYGTGEPGPTNAFAPGEKTARHFGGTLKGGITAGDDE